MGWGEPSQMVSQTPQMSPYYVGGSGGGLEGALVYSFRVLPSCLVLRVRAVGWGRKAEDMGGAGQGQGEGVKLGLPPRPEEARALGERAHRWPLA